MAVVVVVVVVVFAVVIWALMLPQCCSLAGARAGLSHGTTTLLACLHATFSCPPPIRVGAGATCRYVFDMRPGDIYFSTADCGWITGHTYLTYGPLLNGVTSIVFGGVPAHPDAGRVWSLIEKHKVGGHSARGEGLGWCSGRLMRLPVCLLKRVSQLAPQWQSPSHPH